MKPDHRARRYKARTQVERFIARLEDKFGGRMIFSPGKQESDGHLKYGVMVLMADQLLGNVS